MSPRLPRITAQELLRALRRDGWVEIRQRGSHIYLRHLEKPGYVTVAMHTGKIIHPATLQSILQQAGITPDDLRELL